jgi:hypothetical protein
MGSILAIVGGGGEGLAAPGEEYVHFFLCWLVCAVRLWLWVLALYDSSTSHKARA